jgi:hypothetical protein
MKHILVGLGLFAGVVALSATEASAVVCARGVHRAGCVAPRGVAVVTRPVGVRRGGVVVGRGAGGAVVRRGGVVVRR